MRGRIRTLFGAVAARRTDGLHRRGKRDIRVRRGEERLRSGRVRGGCEVAWIVV